MAVTTAITPTTTTRNRLAWVAITILGAMIAMALGPQGPLGGFWGAEPAAELGITGSLAAAFVGYALIEAVGFGLGLAWLLLGRSQVAASTLGTATYLAVGWVLTSWWPHGSFHQAIGDGNYQGLIRIEYGFHATMLVAGAIVAVYIWRTARGLEHTS